MVSLWPWKATDETASFEKTLSALSTKINTANATRDRLRTRSRRYKVIWTLYTSLAYLLSALILVLVTGWRNWGPVEYSVIAGGPVVIYLVRTALSSFYDYRLSSSQAYLADLQKQREDAIEKFKTATKYNSTQQLLEKYGAAPPKPPSTPKSESSSSNRKPKQAGAQPARTGMAPPPTANIRRPGDYSSAPSTPAPGQAAANEPSPLPASAHSAHTAYAAFNGMTDSPQAPSPPSPSAEFAPNAYTNPPQYSTIGQAQAYAPQWYDRIMDLLLGEDETKPSNRLALICQHCKLVNGLAPPGARLLEDVGRWRCSGCKGWNGVDKVSEVRRIVKEAASAVSARGVGGEGEASSGGELAADTGGREHDVSDDLGENQGADEDVDDDEDDGDIVEQESDGVADDADDAVAANDGPDEPPARSTRSQRSTTRKKG